MDHELLSGTGTSRSHCRSAYKPDSGATRAQLCRHHSCAQWENTHFRQLRNLASHAKTKFRAGGRLFYSAFVEKRSPWPVIGALSRGWRRDLSSLSIQFQNRLGHSCRISVRPRRTFQRTHPSTERKTRDV